MLHVTTFVNMLRNYEVQAAVKIT